MKIKHKLTGAFLIVVIIPMIVVIFTNQSMTKEAIQRGYEEKGITNARQVVGYSLAAMADKLEGFIELLSKDAKLNSAAYYLNHVGSIVDAEITLPKYASELGLSFLEITDKEGRITFSTLDIAGDRKYKHRLDESLMKAFRFNEYPVDLIYDKDLEAFVISSVGLIVRKNKPIGMVHGGYIIDDVMLTTLLNSDVLTLYDANGQVAVTTGPVAPDAGFINALFSRVSSACRQDPISLACTEAQVAVANQNSSSGPYLFVATPLRLPSALPVGTAVVAHVTNQMEEDLNNALITTIAIFSPMCVIGVVISFFISHRLAKPLIDLATQIKGYGAGMSTIQPATISTDTVEVNELWRSFSNMIDARARAEAQRELSEAQQRLLLESTGEAIYGIDLEGRCTFANPACAKVIGYETPNELTGLNMHKLIHHSHEDGTLYPVDECRIYATFPKGEPIHVDNEVFWHKDGHCFPVEYHSSPIKRDDEIIGAVITFMDISVRKQAQDEIIRLNAELEQRVEQRTAELRATNQTLEESLQELHRAQNQLVQSEKMAALGGLVAGVAHEINTPVGIGVTAASHLEDKTREYEAKYKANTLTREDFESFLLTARELSGIIFTNLMRAADLVRSFKQVAVDQSSGQKRVFNVGEYLAEVLQSLRPKFKRTKHMVALDCPDNLDIYSYPGAFSQIVTNLVINTLIHGFEEIEAGEIHLIVSVNDDSLKLCYKDNGKGVPEDDLKKIFDPFFTTKRGQGGSGLGMHVIYNLITQTLGGQIVGSSTPGQGVSFEITIPMALLDIAAADDSVNSSDL